MKKNRLVDSQIVYHPRRHAAAWTNDYKFNQLIPYIGNKRKLLDLIQLALLHVGPVEGATFLDLFAGSGVVSRVAKVLGYTVIANDWEPYTRPINTCYIHCNSAPPFAALGGYHSAIAKLNSLPPRVDWVTEHLCPRDDQNYDTSVDRMFYMRKNGMRMDAIRQQIQEWKETGAITDTEECCLIAPLLYQGCYTSNTSGVFKGFHNGWGGQTKTALYRICSDLRLCPSVFYDNARGNSVLCMDAQLVAQELSPREINIAYIDPPYNQHPYGSNYHVLNTLTLWDSPPLSRHITRRTKSAIRTDWRTKRRSAYNYKSKAAAAYSKLLETLNAHHILTSYSTDGLISLQHMLSANVDRGRVRIEMQAYKRYRVSSQRFSRKPMNIEFVIVLDTHRKSDTSPDELMAAIASEEEHVLQTHPELRIPSKAQPTLFEGIIGHGEEA